jgi:hypothetical protein
MHMQMAAQVGCERKVLLHSGLVVKGKYCATSPTSAFIKLDRMCSPRIIVAIEECGVNKRLHTLFESNHHAVVRVDSVSEAKPSAPAGVPIQIRETAIGGTAAEVKSKG